MKNITPQKTLLSPSVSVNNFKFLIYNSNPEMTNFRNSVVKLIQTNLTQKNLDPETNLLLYNLVYAMALNFKKLDTVYFEKNFLKFLCHQLRILPKNTSVALASTDVQILSAILSSLSHLAKYDSMTRKLVTAICLPKRNLNDVILNKPEDDLVRSENFQVPNDKISETQYQISALLISNLSSTNNQVVRLVSRFVYILCKENKDVFINRVGYGNAAGFLVNFSEFLKGEEVEDGDYSEIDENDNLGDWEEEENGDDESRENIHKNDEEATETEKLKFTPASKAFLSKTNQETLTNLKKFGKYDTVTGTFKLDEDPFQNMSDDEKEREANKLACLIQDLAKIGMIKPASQNSDGSLNDLCLDGRVMRDAFKEMSGLEVDPVEE